MHAEPRHIRRHTLSKYPFSSSINRLPIIFTRSPIFFDSFSPSCIALVSQSALFSGPLPLDRPISPPGPAPRSTSPNPARLTPTLQFACTHRFLPPPAQRTLHRPLAVPPCCQWLFGSRFDLSSHLSVPTRPRVHGPLIERGCCPSTYYCPPVLSAGSTVLTPRSSLSLPLSLSIFPAWRRLHDLPPAAPLYRSPSPPDSALSAQNQSQSHTSPNHALLSIYMPLYSYSLNSAPSLSLSRLTRLDTSSRLAPRPPTHTLSCPLSTRTYICML